MQDDEKNEVGELEEAYKQTISSASIQPSSGNSSLTDEKQKIQELLSTIDKSLDVKKSVVEKKLGDLKALKAEIEAGLDELKKTEGKKTTLQSELSKIEKVVQEQQQIESEVADISSQI